MSENQDVKGKKVKKEKKQRERGTGRRSQKGRHIATIAKLFVYPFKSCGAIELDKSALGVRGLQYDRCFALVELGAQSSLIVRLLTKVLQMQKAALARVPRPSSQRDPNHDSPSCSQLSLTMARYV